MWYLIGLVSPDIVAVQGGRMSQFLERMKVGETTDFKGPLGHFIYTAPGQYMMSGKQGKVRHLSMIAGGTGITPMYQIIQVGPQPCPACSCGCMGWFEVGRQGCSGGALTRECITSALSAPDPARAGARLAALLAWRGSWL